MGYKEQLWVMFIVSLWHELMLAYSTLRLGAPFPPAQPDIQRAFISKLSALQETHNAACLKNGNHGMLKSVGTAAVVQDMVRIVEALGEDGLNYLG